MFVLEGHHRVAFEITAVSFHVFGFGLRGEHPAHVRVPETFVDAVRVFVGVDKAVVHAVVARPN